MKSIFFSFCTFIFISCSSHIKEQTSPIDDFLNSTVTNKEEIIIIEEKINSNLTLEIFKGTSVYSTYRRDSVKVEGVDYPLYSYSQWKKMNLKYRNNKLEKWLANEKWMKKDFKFKNIVFMKYSNFPKADLWNDSLRNINNNKDVYAFSQPIFYKNKTIACFAFSKCGTSSYTYSIEPRKIVLMKNKNKKWVIYQTISDGNY